jgi:hypothetical protein
MRIGIATAILVMLSFQASRAATVQKHYYAYDAVHDKYGVIAPWYKGQNGQLDDRVRIAAETLKRYPWTDTSRAIAALPEYMFSSSWKIGEDGAITVPMISDWMDGDLGQRSSYVLSGLVDYYRYTGDPAAIAHMTLQGNMLLDYCQTPADNPWPAFLISVPTKGKPYYRCDPNGYIQLDIVSEVGYALLKAYQVTGEKRWFESAKHWGDLLAEHCDLTPGAMPWPRYANPEVVKWKQNKQTGGVAFHLTFLDELIRLGYRGRDDALVKARDAGRAYLRDTLLPNWTVNDSFGINYWDWESNVQIENVTEFACRYMMDNKDYFPNWRNDVRNVLSLFLNHTSVNPASRGDVYSGAWAYPESSSCCGRSLWYPAQEISWPFAQYGVEADSEWAREIARRSLILATYDVHDTGYSEDNIDGGVIVNGAWFKIAHPMALKHLLAAIGCMPEVFGPSRENHIVWSTGVVNDVRYRDRSISYSTFDAPKGTIEALRLSAPPSEIRAFPGGRLEARMELNANGYTVTELPNGDCIVRIRHDGATSVEINGKFPIALTTAGRTIEKAGDETTYEFTGNQVRVVGSVGPKGGLADVYLDGRKQLAGIDCWNPKSRFAQTLYYRSGLANDKHSIRVVARGEKNPCSAGTRITLDSIQSSSATGSTSAGEGGGPKNTQRFIFGYPGREDFRDSQGHTWRPGTEFAVRLAEVRADSVVRTWWTDPVAAPIENTKEPEIYRYGVHAPEFVVNSTVGPGKYRVVLHFAATRGVTGTMTIAINGKKVIENLDVLERAGGPNKALDLVFNDITPQNGIIDIRFIGLPEAFVQAIEVGQGRESGGETHD